MNTFLLYFLLQTGAESSDVLLKDGKMYSVLAVLLVIFLALLAYLFLTDRKLSAIERKLKK